MEIPSEIPAPAPDPLLAIPEAARAIYAEAGHWLRMVNMIAWTTAALLVPTSVACIGVGLVHQRHRIVLTLGSFSVLVLWIVIMERYAWSAIRAREVLRSIEASWKVPDHLALYTVQQAGGPGRAALQFQIAITLFVTLAWVYVYLFT